MVQYVHLVNIRGANVQIYCIRASPSGRTTRAYNVKMAKYYGGAYNELVQEFSHPVQNACQLRADHRPDGGLGRDSGHAAKGR